MRAAPVGSAAQARVIAVVMQRSGVRAPTVRAAPRGTVWDASMSTGAAAVHLV